MNKDSQIEDSIDKVVDKHTKALTKEGNVLNFDLVLVNVFEIKKELSTLLNTEIEQKKRNKREIPKIIRCYLCNKKTDLIYKGNSICLEEFLESNYIQCVKSISKVK